MELINHRAILLLREDRPAVLKKRGDINSILPASQFVGSKVDKSNDAFVIIYVTDLPLELENQLVIGDKVFKIPSGDDPMIVALQSHDDKAGKITVNTEVLLNYIESADV